MEADIKKKERIQHKRYDERNLEQAERREGRKRNDGKGKTRQAKSRTHLDHAALLADLHVKFVKVQWLLGHLGHSSYRTSFVFIEGEQVLQK